MEPTAILQPVIALGLWTGVMMIWMYATRIPAATKAGINPHEEWAHVHITYLQMLPSEVRASRIIIIICLNNRPCFMQSQFRLPCWVMVTKRLLPAPGRL